MSQIRGRFHRAADKLVAEYTTSLPFDWRLYRHDIDGSIAHVKMLARQGIISGEEAETIVRGLATIKEEIERGDWLLQNTTPDFIFDVPEKYMWGQAARTLGVETNDSASIGGHA